MRLVRIRAAIAACAALVALTWMMAGATFALANPGGDNIASAIATALPLVADGSIDATTTDMRDVYAITLKRGQTLDVRIALTSAETSDTDFDLFLYRPGTTSIDETHTPRAMWSATASSNEHFTFMAADAGTYYIDVAAWAGAGSYTLNAKIISAVPFKISGLSVPKSAKHGKKVKVAATVTPAYNGTYAPVFFHFYRYEHGKYKQKAVVAGSGTRNPGQAKSTLYAYYKFAKKGKWRVRAEFWDEAHSRKFTSYKYITIK